MPGEHKLGKVVSCRNHADYFISVFREGELSEDLHPKDHGIGKYVKIGEPGKGDMIIGMVISSQLLSDQGLKFGLNRQAMSTQDTNIFTPEIMDGSVKIIEARGIGIMRTDGSFSLGLPSTSPAFQDPVTLLTREEVVRFHTSHGKLHLEYLREVVGGGDPQRYAAVINALADLREYLPDQRPIIDLIHNEMVWNARMKG